MKRKKKVKRRNKTKVIHQKMDIGDVVQIYNFFGGIIGIWAIYPIKSLKIAITMSMIAASIGFVIMFRYNKSVEFATKDKSRPSVGVTIFLNSVAIWVMGGFYSNTIYSSHFWMLFIICCIILIFLTTIIKKYSLKNIPYLILLVATIAAYSMGTIINVNYLYDNSKPTVYSTSIAEKEIYESGVRYHIKLYQVWVSPWESSGENTKVVVSEEFYDAVYNHEEVKVCVQSGLLGIQWYYLET